MRNGRARALRGAEITPAAMPLLCTERPSMIGCAKRQGSRDGGHHGTPLHHERAGRRDVVGRYEAARRRELIKRELANAEELPIGGAGGWGTPRCCLVSKAEPTEARRRRENFVCLS